MIGEFKEVLKAKRRGMSPAMRKKTRKNPRKIIWLYPTATEAKYRTMIRNIVGLPLRKAVNQTIKVDLSKWIDEKKRSDSIEINIDTYIEEIRKFIMSLGIQISDAIFGAADILPEDSPIWPEFILIALAIFMFNEGQWGKQTEPFLGFEFVSDAVWWDDVREAWATENYNLIKSLSEDYIGRVNEVVFRGVREGKAYTEIVKELRESYEKTFGPRSDGKASRLELLVRDQIGKLNGEITKKRQQEVGIDMYIWSTSLDERVRGNPGGKFPNAIPSHWVMEGLICKWDDSSVFAREGNTNTKGNLIFESRTADMPQVHPGYEILCRCVGIAYWNQILSEIDEEIEK